MIRSRHLLFFSALFFSFQICYAATIVWTNTAGGTWNKTNNWSPNQIPGGLGASNSDDVQITTPGTYKVTFNAGSPYYVHSLTLGAGSGNGAQTLAVSSKTLYANSLTVTGGGVLVDNGSTFYAAIYAQSGGQLISTNGTYFATPLIISSGGQMKANSYYSAVTLHGSVTVDAGGLLSMSSYSYGDTSATIANDCSLNANAGGAINISSGAMNLYGPMTNSGNVTMTLGRISIQNDGSVNRGYLLNQPPGMIRLNNSTIQGLDPLSQIINRGAIICTGANAWILATNLDTSAGTVSNLVSGAILNLGYFTNTLTGTFYAASGSTNRLNGGTGSAPLLQGNPLLLAGGGVNQFYSGWLDLPTNIIPKLDLAGGVLELEPTFQGGAITNLALDGITFTNTYALPVTNGTFATTNSWLYGSYRVESGGVWNALGGGIFGPATVRSGGIFSAGTTVYAPGFMNIESNGVVNLFKVMLSLYSPLTNYGTLNISNGWIQIYNYLTTDACGGVVNQADGTITFLDGGWISGNNYDEYIVNNGRIIKGTNSSSATFQITPYYFTNSGMVTVLGGTLNLYWIALQPNSILNVRLNSKTSYGKLHIITPSLAGTFGVTLADGYTPVVGDSFTPLVSGRNFTAIDLPPLIMWQKSYETSDGTLTLLVTGPIPSFSSFTKSGSNIILIGSNGIPGNPFSVLASTNLAKPLTNWTSLATNTLDGAGRFTFTNTMDPTNLSQFFILKMQ
jgi:hypothetical protein